MDTLRERKVSVVGVSTDSIEDSLIFARKYAVEFPLCADADLAVSDSYGVAQAGMSLSIPAMFAVRPDGAIVWRHVGETMSDHPPQTQILQATASFDRTVHPRARP